MDLTAARALLRRFPLVDGHNDLPWALRTQAEYDLDALDIARPQPTLHTDLPRLRAGGLAAQFWSVFVSCATPDPVAATLEQIDCVHRLAARHPHDLVLATGADQVRAAFAAGRVASLLGAEGGHSIGGSLGVLRMLFALGVRYLTLTHNENVPWADSATDVPAVGGLAPFGVEVVREMNRLGMLVDCSHVAATTMRGALAATTAPLLFSHSSAFALCDHPRNVPDDVLAQLPGNGGLCMVTFVPRFVSQACADWQRDADADAATAGVDVRDLAALDAWNADRARRDPPPRATLAQVADHVEHVREVAGVGHVGIGGDYDGTSELPDGLADVSCYPALVAELGVRGWSPAELGMLVGGNVIRVLRTAAEVAT